MSTRLNLLADRRFVELQPALRDRLGQVAASVTPENFPSLLDPLARHVLEHAFREATAHEGTVWLADSAGAFLVPTFNTGPDAARWVKQFKQPLKSGLISMVFASEQPFIENEVFKNAAQNKALDAQLQVQTHALIAVPFHLLNACRGVISCVQLRPTAATASAALGFQPGHLAVIERAGELLTRLLEYRLLGITVGWIAE